MKFTSNAKWPKRSLNLGNEENVSQEVHDSRQAAQEECDWLMSRGHGGTRTFYPLRTWVGEVSDAN